ncbi:hypothetical protein [Paenibacillus brevis]|uniref:ABC transporter permease n=1 Tax=Paenibacillus brevis TaxID=2841508 RepID=A0ABS6FM27_9BACL|nr:hypothetical protein [Paenibacillus brevis]MBU5671044.1 hypothetical protein [Paenibacillus brevis]
MMKLFKYDWKRDSNTIYSVLAVLVIAQLLFHWVGTARGWDPMIRLAVSLMMYVSAMVVMVITGSKGYIKNLKSYQRRLVPIHPIYHVLSSLLFSTLIMMAVFVIAAAHGLLLIPWSDLTAFLELGNLQLTAWDVIIAAASGIWGTFFVMLLIYFSMTVGAMVNIRGKAGVWVGIIVFIILSNIISSISETVFRQAGSATNFGIVQIESGPAAVPDTVTVSSLGTGLGGFLFELVAAVLLLWLMAWPIRKKLEI